MNKKKLVWAVIGVLAFLGIVTGIYFQLGLNKPAQLPKKVL